MAAINPLPYLPPELWLEIFSHLDDPLSLWRSRVISCDCRENVDAYFRSTIIPTRINLYSRLDMNDQIEADKYFSFFSHYSHDGRFAYFRRCDTLTKFRHTRSVAHTKILAQGLFVKLFPDYTEGKKDCLEMSTYTIPFASEDGSWKGVKFRNRMSVRVETGRLVKKIDEPADVAVSEGGELKIRVDAEKDVVGFDWRLCLDRLLLPSSQQL
jgi:hypothetical protein